MVDYLKTQIAESRHTAQPRWGMTRMGYTQRGGAPSSVMIRLVGESRWRRLMIWQTSNAGTAFVRIKGKPYVVHDTDIPAPRKIKSRRSAFTSRSRSFFLRKRKA